MLMLFVKDVTQTYPTIDPNSGKSELKRFNSVSFLRELGIRFCPMPSDYPMWMKAGKDGKKHAVTLEDLGVFVLARVDESGGIQNRFGGSKDFRRPVPVSLHTINELAALFRPREPGSTTGKKQ